VKHGLAKTPANFENSRRRRYSVSAMAPNPQAPIPGDRFFHCEEEIGWRQLASIV